MRRLAAASPGPRTPHSRPLPARFQGLLGLTTVRQYLFCFIGRFIYLSPAKIVTPAIGQTWRAWNYEDFLTGHPRGLDYLRILLLELLYFFNRFKPIWNDWIRSVDVNRLDLVGNLNLVKLSLIEFRPLTIFSHYLRNHHKLTMLLELLCFSTDLNRFEMIEFGRLMFNCG